MPGQVNVQGWSHHHHPESRRSAMHDDHAGQSDHPIDAALDEAENESFPASDPQSSWAGADPASPAAPAAGDAGSAPAHEDCGSLAGNDSFSASSRAASIG